MSAIPCASVSLKTMADGTLRISFDIEPMHAQDAFKLFAAPGTPAAIAALQVGYAAIPNPVELHQIRPDPDYCRYGVCGVNEAHMPWCREYSEFERRSKTRHNAAMTGPAGV